MALTKVDCNVAKGLQVFMLEVEEVKEDGFLVTYFVLGLSFMSGLPTIYETKKEENLAGKFNGLDEPSAG